MFLTSTGIVDLIGTNALHSPRRCQKLHPSFIGSILDMRRSVMWNMLHSFEPIIGVAELRNDECLVWISIRGRILEPMFVSSEFRANLGWRRGVQDKVELTA